jgi:hypothetical protein
MKPYEKLSFCYWSGVHCWIAFQPLLLALVALQLMALEGIGYKNT